MSEGRGRSSVPLVVITACRLMFTRAGAASSSGEAGEWSTEVGMVGLGREPGVGGAALQGTHTHIRSFSDNAFFLCLLSVQLMWNGFPQILQLRPFPPFKLTLHLVHFSMSVAFLAMLPLASLIMSCFSTMICSSRGVR